MKRTVWAMLLGMALLLVGVVLWLSFAVSPILGFLVLITCSGYLADALRSMHP